MMMTLGSKRAAPVDAGQMDARQIRSRKALGEALLALLTEKPFDHLTVREISRRAGIGYATFFRHYETKEALLADIACDEIRDLLNRGLPIMADADSLEATRTLCCHVGEHRKLWSALLAGGAAGMVRAAFIQEAQQMPMPKRRDWLPASLSTIHATGSMIDGLAWWLTVGLHLSCDQIAAILHRLVIAPLLGIDRPGALA